MLRCYLGTALEKCFGDEKTSKTPNCKFLPIWCRWLGGGGAYLFYSFPLADVGVWSKGVKPKIESPLLMKLNYNCY